MSNSGYMCFVLINGMWYSTLFLLYHCFKVNSSTSQNSQCLKCIIPLEVASSMRSVWVFIYASPITDALVDLYDRQNPFLYHWVKTSHWSRQSGPTFRQAPMCISTILYTYSEFNWHLVAAEQNSGSNLAGLRIYGLLTDLKRFKFYSYGPVTRQFYHDEDINIRKPKTSAVCDMINGTSPATWIGVRADSSF